MRWGMAWALILLLMCPALRALDARLLFPDGTPVAGAQVTILKHPGQSRTDRRGEIPLVSRSSRAFEVRVELPVDTTRCTPSSGRPSLKGLSRWCSGRSSERT